MKIKVIIHDAEEGGYWAEVPGIPGCATQGETFEELLKNLYEAIEGCLSVDIEPTKSDDHQRILEIAERDKATLGKIVDLADDVAKCAFKGRDICVPIPMRTRSNTIWNRKRGILQMGEAKANRELFNLNQAKQFMQTCLHGNSIKELIG